MCKNEHGLFELKPTLWARPTQLSNCPQAILRNMKVSFCLLSFPTRTCFYMGVWANATLLLCIILSVCLYWLQSENVASGLDLIKRILEDKQSPQFLHTMTNTWVCKRKKPGKGEGGLGAEVPNWWRGLKETEKVNWEEMELEVCPRVINEATQNCRQVKKAGKRGWILKFFLKINK